MHSAYKLAPTEGMGKLRRQAKWLQTEHPDAAASLLETGADIHREPHESESAAHPLPEHDEPGREPHLISRPRRFHGRPYVWLVGPEIGGQDLPDRARTASATPTRTRSKQTCSRSPALERPRADAMPPFPHVCRRSSDHSRSRLDVAVGAARGVCRRPGVIRYKQARPRHRPERGDSQSWRRGRQIAQVLRLCADPPRPQPIQELS